MSGDIFSHHCENAVMNEPVLSPAATSDILILSWTVAAVLAVLVYRHAARRRARLGEAPVGLHPISWGVVTLLLGPFGLLFYVVAAYGQHRRQRSGTQPPAN